MLRLREKPQEFRHSFRPERIVVLALLRLQIGIIILHLDHRLKLLCPLLQPLLLRQLRLVVRAAAAMQQIDNLAVVLLLCRRSNQHIRFPLQNVRVEIQLIE